MNHKVKIHVAGNGTCDVTLDGHPIETVAIGFNTALDDVAEVTLVIRPSEVEIDTDVDEEKLTIVEALPQGDGDCR